MASGTIIGSTGNEYIDAKIEWYSTPNAVLHKSYVHATLYYKRNNTGYTTDGTGTFSITINGKSTSASKTLSITENEWVKAIEATQEVNHINPWTITISASGSIPGTPLSSTHVSGAVTLPATGEHIVYESSTLDSLSCATQYFNGSMTYKYTPKNANYYNRCNISLNLNGEHIAVKTINLGKKSTSQQTATVTLAEIELAIIYNKLPSATKGTLRFTLCTYSDSAYSTQVDSGEIHSAPYVAITTKEITLNIPNDSTTQPTIAMSLASVNSLPSPYNSLYIQGHSKVKATLDISTKYGATVEASNITVNGNTYAFPYESDILSQTGTITVKATAKDSRGYYGTNYKDIEVIPYSKPYIQAKSGETTVIVARCDSSANLTDSGTYLKIKAKVVYSKVISSGVQNNYGNIKFRYRKEGSAYSAWQTILNCKTDNSDEVITPPLLNGTLDITSNYQVQIIATDDLYDSVPITIAVPSDEVYTDKPAGGKSMGLGGYSSGDGNLDIYWKTKARGGISLFDAKGDEIPLDTTLPLPRDQIKGTWDPNNLECGVHVVANNNALKTGDTVIMYNGVLIQMKGDVGGNVKLQLALPADANRNPMYRLCWYSNWSDWRSLKI